jgi:hypothetical protein
MVTILFLGILAAVAVPSFQAMALEMRLGQGAREVERELQTARLKAVTTNRPVRVRFNCPEPNHDGPARQLPSGVEFGSADTLEFWPDGSVHKQIGGTNPWDVVSSEGTAVTLTKGETVKVITVNGLGKIALQ